MNRNIPIYIIFLYLSLVACNAQNEKKEEAVIAQDEKHAIGNKVNSLGDNIDCIYQDRSNNYWFASNGNGVYRYDGKTLLQFTEKDGLCSNFVWLIQEDINGSIWFSTRDGFCNFDGKNFIDQSYAVKNASSGTLSNTKRGVFLAHQNGICMYDGRTFTNFSITPPGYVASGTNMNRPFSVYSIMVDRDNNIWMGTQERGVCRYDGRVFSYYTDEGLDKAAVRCLFQDHNGTIWAGNNGVGLFRFNGTKFINFTEEKGLSNVDFLNKLSGKEGTLARPWSIEESDGKLIVGTIDAGAWIYDGSDMKNLTVRDGLPGNSIWKIYKDKSGQLWIVSDGKTLSKFHSNRFDKVVF